MKGFSLVEVVVGAAIAATVVTAVAMAWSFYQKLAGQSVRLTQADLLIEEGAEVLQYWRDDGWNSNIGNLSTGTAYYISWNGSDYAASTATSTVNGMRRTLVLAPIYRDASFNIAPSGTLDPGTLTATLSVYPASSSAPILQAQTLIHDVFAN